PGVIDAIALPQGDNSRPFFSYAIQWLSFGAIAILGFGYFVYREFRDPVDGDIYVNGGPPRSDEAVGTSRHEARSAGYDATAAPAARQPEPAADAAAPASDVADRAAEVAPAAAGRRRAKFDKSQLYDS